MYYYRKQQLLKNLFILILSVLLLVLLITTIKGTFHSNEKAAEKAIKQFYTYEEEGKFSSSWEMFHPELQKRFTKGHYIQDRAHVFLNHFNIEAFTVSYGKIEKLDMLQFHDNLEPITDAYEMPIVLHIKGKYGNMKISQDVYTVKVEDEWKILWDYKKQ